MNIISGNIVNIFDGHIEFGVMIIEKGRIKEIHYYGIEKEGEKYVLPGFIDAHVHIESSMLTPVQFARLAVVHGTIGTVSDPHEIANVLGIDGVKYMIENANQVPFKFCFGAPSCVPATKFETAGAELNVNDIAELFKYKEVGYLAEMMNFPGVLKEDPIVMQKIRLAQAYNKPVDGHAPGLQGAAAKKYIAAGIDTDHECFQKAEALEKLKLGMKILIREGSAAKNFDELIDLAHEHSEMMMFCSDDKHPDNLVEGHINQLVKRALEKGVDMFKVLRMACLNPILHYRMNVGLLREGDWADCILVDNLKDFNILETYLNGEKVADRGTSLLPNLESEIVNNFHCEPKVPEQFQIMDVEADLPNYKIRAIQVIDKQLITEEVLVSPHIKNGFIVSDVNQDILKIAVINRYKEEAPSVGFIKGFGLQEGAIASCVGHDSHNIIVVGVDDESICEAVNLIIREKGGISAVSNSKKGILSLPIAGIMSPLDGYKVAQDYTTIDKFVKEQLSCTLTSPFMSLSFMALLVIPALKLSDKGLFDGTKFQFVSNFYQKLKAEDL